MSRSRTRVGKMKAFLPICDDNGRHFVYAFGLLDGRTKIGTTTRPGGRFITHVRENKDLLAWFHLFPAAGVSFWTERKVLERVLEAGYEPIGTTIEWFMQLPRETVLAIARPVVAEHAQEHLRDVALAKLRKERHETATRLRAEARRKKIEAQRGQP